MSDVGNADHDWDGQYRETAWVWNDLRSKNVDFERAYKLDLQFLPSNSTADRDGFAAALRTAGFDVRFFPDDPTVEARTGPMILSIESIWSQERQTTALALRYGFEPDGWGFFED